MLATSYEHILQSKQVSLIALEPYCVFISERKNAIMKKNIKKNDSNNAGSGDSIGSFPSYCVRSK